MYELSKIEINEWHNNADTKSAIEQNLILDYRRLEGLTLFHFLSSNFT